MKPMKKHVLFIQGGGEGAYDADALLAASLRDALGSSYEVHYPKMPNEDEPEYAVWKDRITSEIAALGSDAIVVGHSLGGSVLLKVLAEARIDTTIAGAFLIATPHFGKEPWIWPDVQLPEDVATRLANIPRLFFYHGDDDEGVPFEHLHRYAKKFPRATVRALKGRDHQLGNDLSDVAADIRHLEPR